MRVFIYGGGAVGLGLASFLIASGAEVTLLARPATAERLRAEGLRRSGIFGDFSAPPNVLKVIDTPVSISSTPSITSIPFDHILVCVKAFDTGEAARNLRAGFGPEPQVPITIFQNGWGSHEIFAEYFPKRIIHSARVITGFARPEPNHVQITVHADDVRVGSLFGGPTTPIEPLCAAITRGGYPCSPAPDVARHLWAKMLYNCALNPLGAIVNATYGELADSPHTAAIMDRVIDEVFAAMTASGYETHWPTAAEYRRAFYEKLVPPTAAHRSSTLQDLRAGKRTEIDAFCGEITRLAARHNLTAPVNESLFNMVRHLESHR